MSKPLDTWPLERATIVEWEPHPQDTRAVTIVEADGITLEACAFGVLVGGVRLVPWVNVLECTFVSAPA